MFDLDKIRNNYKLAEEQLLKDIQEVEEHIKDLVIEALEKATKLGMVKGRVFFTLDRVRQEISYKLIGSDNLEILGDTELEGVPILYVLHRKLYDSLVIVAKSNVITAVGYGSFNSAYITWDFSNEL